MRKTIVVSAIALLSSIVLAAQQKPAPAGAVKFTRISVHDPGINNIEALSFLSPLGWKVEGGIKWYPDYSILANLLMRITDPQTGAQVEFLPIQNFTWMPHPVMPMQPGTNYMGNIFAPPATDLREFVKEMYMPQVLKHLQRARVVSAKNFPKIEDQIKQNYGGQAEVKSGVVRYEYQMNGQSWQEDVYLTLVFTGSNDITIWQETAGYSFRAPAGKLDDLTPLMATAVTTMRLTPDWYSGYMYVQKLFMNRMNQGIADAKAISDTVTRNSEEIRKMFADSYKQSQETNDRISQNYSEYMRGIDTYKDPFAGRPVELPSGYDNAWVSAQGEYVLTNETGFDPNVGDTHEWRRMDRRGQ